MRRKTLVVVAAALALATTMLATPAVGYAGISLQGLVDYAVRVGQRADDRSTKALKRANAVRSEQIVNGQVKAGDLAAGAVEARHIARGAVWSSSIAAGAIGPTLLADDAVGSRSIAAGAVGPTQLAAGAVGPTRLAARAVGSLQLADDAVGRAQLARDAAGADQIAAGAVASDELASDAVTSSKVADGSLREADVAVDAGAIGLDPPAIASGRCALVTAPKPGIAVGDRVVLNAPGSLEDGLVAAPVVQPTADVLTVRLCNATDTYRTVAVDVDPPDLAAQTAALVPVAFPAGTVPAGAALIVDPPADLEADLTVGNARVTAADAAQLSIHSVAAVNGALKTWTFHVVAPAGTSIDGAARTWRYIVTR
ncbi:MAG: hypothetical protein QOG35_2456 [Solirubrobacteraceae bacterium]|jgi:hypothetical protein|nr:hypothetical protein [Solirubrobacteraceae bacterium]